ncbi:hypothetical protein LXL04_008321 [Taraxacum kok-saghyz]
MSVLSFNLPLSFGSVQGLDAKTIYTPICYTTRATRCQRASVIANGIGGGSAKYKGTQMREKKLTELIESKIAEATQVCEGDRDSDECKVAWDEVEEVSQAKADLRRKLDENKDPLQSFCEENPETDECLLVLTIVKTINQRSLSWLKSKWNPNRDFSVGNKCGGLDPSPSEHCIKHLGFWITRKWIAGGGVLLA